MPDEVAEPFVIETKVRWWNTHGLEEEAKAQLEEVKNMSNRIKALEILELEKYRPRIPQPFISIGPRVTYGWAFGAAPGKTTVGLFKVIVQQAIAEGLFAQGTS